MKIDENLNFPSQVLSMNYNLLETALEPDTKQTITSFDDLLSTKEMYVGIFSERYFIL